MNDNINITNTLVYLFFFIISFVTLGLIQGFDTLNPFYIDWLSWNEDLLSYHIPWILYKNSDFSLNLFQNYNYGIEISETLFFSDNVILINLILKVFFKNIQDFQFISTWQIFCIFMQLYFAYKIFFLKTQNLTYSLLSSLFFITLPFFLDRILIHISLAAHWLILASIYFSLKKKVFESSPEWISLLVLSILININLAFFIFLIFNFSTFNELLKKRITITYALKSCFFFSSTALIVLILVGFFNISTLDYMDYGYGYYKSNFFSLIDSLGGLLNQEWSLIFNDIHSNPGEQEGFAFIGSGLIFMIIYIFYYYLSSNEKIKLNFFFFLGLIFFILSLSNNLSFGSYNLSINLNKYLFGIMSIFRSSGRFIWLTGYLIIVFTLLKIYFLHKRKQKILNLFLFLVLFFQVFDCFYLFKKQNYSKLHNSTEVKEFFQDIKILRSTYTGSNSEDFFKSAKYIIGEKIEKTDIVYLSRIDRLKVTINRYTKYDTFYKGQLDENTVYFINKIHLPYFFKFFNNDDFVFLKDGKNYLIKKKVRDNKKKYKPQLNLITLPLNQYIDPKKNLGILGLGWDVSRSIWTDGQRSTLLFKTKTKPKSIILKTKIFNFSNENIQNYELFINNTKKKFTIEEMENKIYEIIIDLKNDNQNHHEYVLDIKNNNKVSRSDLLIAPDPRILGLNLIALKVN